MGGSGLGGGVLGEGILLADGGVAAPGRRFGFVVPDLYCPFPPAISPHAEEVQEHTVRWASSLGLLGPDGRSIGSFRAAAMGRLAARTYPRMEPEELSLVSNFYAWLFFRDDERDEATEVGRSPTGLSAGDRRLLEVLGGADPAGGDGPMARAALDLRERLDRRPGGAAGSGTLPRRRFLRALAEHLQGTVWEARNRAEGVVPDPATYVRMRRLTGGLSTVTALAEILEGGSLPGHAREHPTVRRLTAASDNAIGWANDLFSLQKELANGDVHNLVVVLARHEGICLGEATLRVARMHDEEVRAFEAAERRLPSFGAVADRALGRYVGSLRDRVRGHLDWTRESGRFRGPKDPTAG